MRIKKIIPEPRLFYAYQDEKNFFRWLEGIRAIKYVERKKGGLELTLESPIDDDSLADLTALLMRYGLDMKCLRSFCTPKNKEWFRKKGKYWYRYVFGKTRKSRS